MSVTQVYPRYWQPASGWRFRSLVFVIQLPNLNALFRRQIQLTARLQAVLNGGTEIDGVFKGEPDRDKTLSRLLVADADSQQIIERWLEKKNQRNLAALWAGGIDIDWSKLYQKGQRRRLSLPGYCFSKNRYWIEKPAALTGQSSLHPLLDNNVSTLARQLFQKRLRGDEFYLRDHRIGAGGGQNLPNIKVMETTCAEAISRSAITAEDMSYLKSRGTRVAGINSFGLGGSNAFVVVESHPAEAEPVAENKNPSPQPWPTV